MGYALKRYIRKVEVTRTFFQVIESPDEIEYVNRNKMNQKLVGKWSVGYPLEKDIETWRKLTESETVMVMNVPAQGESNEDDNIP